MTDNRKIPVAYEEVALTDEAAAILEKERKAAIERPALKIRRITVTTRPEIAEAGVNGP